MSLTIHCPEFHVSDTGDFYEGCGTEFLPALTEGYAMCPSCGLTFVPPVEPFGVHWSGRPGDTVECTDLPFIDTEESQVPEGYESDMGPLYEGDMVAAVAASRMTANEWVVYLEEGDWRIGDGVEERWIVTLFPTEGQAKRLAESGPERSFYFNGRTHYPVEAVGENVYGYTKAESRDYTGCKGQKTPDGDGRFWPGSTVWVTWQDEAVKGSWIEPDEDAIPNRSNVLVGDIVASFANDVIRRVK